MAEQKQTVRVENKSAHLKHISLPGGETISIPPTEAGVGGGTTVTFESPADRERFEKAIATPAVQAWLDSGELFIHAGGNAPAQPSAAQQVAATQQTASQLEAEQRRAASEPARANRRDKE